MTCIVGYRDKANKTVYIGADRATSDEDYIGTVSKSNRKVFIKDGLIFGVCGDWRVMQVLEHIFNMPPIKARRNLVNYMVSDFTDTIQKCLKKRHISTTEGVQIMVGIRGRLFDIDEDYQVIEPDRIYHAIGHGYQYALGAMHAIKSKKPMVILRAGLAAAAEFDPTVKQPFDIMKVVG